MQTKIINKRVGGVEIFELFGNFVGDFALQSNKALEEIIQKNETKAVLFNVREVTQIDDVGGKSLLRTVDFYRKSAVIEGDLAIAPLLERGTAKHVPVLKNESQAAYFFAREFAESKERSPLIERRRFLRLQAVMPLHLSFETDDLQKMEPFAVITNLSEGGLFAEFIESNSERLVRGNIHPFDLSILNLKLEISEGEFLALQGKMIHDAPAGGGLGIEFYNPRENEVRVITDWLDRQHLRSVGR